MVVGNSELVDAFDQFFRSYYDDEIRQLAQRYPNEQRSIYVDWPDLYRFDPDLADDYIVHPDQLQQYAKEALRLYDLPIDISLSGANVRIRNISETDCRDIGDVRSRDVNRLIGITGTVDSIEQVQSTLEVAAFECQLCGTLNRIPQSLYGENNEPHECQGCERSGKFRVNVSKSNFIDTQTIYVEQRPPGVGTDDDRDVITVKIEDDLVDEVVPGDRIDVFGIARYTEKITNSTASVPDKYIEASAITEASQYPLNIDDADKQEIIRLSEIDSIYDAIIDSIAPTVHGYEREKLGLALQLFSGVTKELPDGSRIRGDIHIAILGDPGVAKSQLARYAARVAPRSVHVSGTNTTKVGLTAAAKRTSNSSKTWTFEAGALPKAHHGICCVDNITDLQIEDHRTLHDVLEEQVVEASKGSSTVSIPASASLLAVGNPKFGRFDPYEPIDEQLSLEPGLVSQLDLLFVLMDQPGGDQDEKIAESILQTNYAGELNTQQAELDIVGVSESEVGKQLDEVAPTIDPELLQKYIAYSRTNCYPRLTDEAHKLIKEFYVEIRSFGVDEDRPVSVSARKLEGFVRLAEASARIRLSDTVDLSDAERVIELARSCFKDIGIDSQSGKSGKYQEDVTKNFRGLVEDLDEEYRDGIPRDILMHRVSEIGMDPKKAEHELDKLFQKGEAYTPAKDVITLT